MVTPLTPALLVVCACGRLGGRASAPVVTVDPVLPERLKIARPSKREIGSIRFINSVGYWAHYDHRTERSSWPVPFMTTVTALASWARRKEILFDRPMYGDVVVVWSSEVNRFIRAAIVASVIDAGDASVRCLTLGRHSAGAKAQLDEFVPAAGDRFVRWFALEPNTLFGIQRSSNADVAA
jgi:hypothetical protein